MCIMFHNIMMLVKNGVNFLKTVQIDLGHKIQFFLAIALNFTSRYILLVEKVVVV